MRGGQTKVTTVGKNETAQFWYTNFWVPDPPPPPHTSQYWSRQTPAWTRSVQLDAPGQRLVVAGAVVRSSLPTPPPPPTSRSSTTCLAALPCA